LDEQESLIEIVRRRLAAEGRKRKADIREAHQELLSGACRPVTVDELMREIAS
jgi:hypothetical protein